MLAQPAPVTAMFVIALVLAGCGEQGAGAPAPASPPEVAAPAPTFPLPGGRVFPEGIAYDPASGDFFVGSTQDGTVYRGNVRRPSAPAAVFLPPGTDGRTAVTGMKVDAAGRLFVSGRFTGRAFVYDARRGGSSSRWRHPPRRPRSSMTSR